MTQKIEWKFVETDGTPEWQDGDFSFPCIAAYDSERARGIVTVPAWFTNDVFYWADSSGQEIETEYRKVIAWLAIPRFYGEYNGQTYESGHVKESE